MDDLAAAFAEFEASIEKLPAVATDARIKPEWRQAMVSYGPCAVEAISNGRRIVVDQEPATPTLMAPIIWCCGRPDAEEDARWVGHALLGVLVHHAPLATETLRWMAKRPEWRLRATSLQTLRCGHPVSVVEELIDQGLRDPHRHVRGMAALAVLACEQRSMLPRLREAASKERLSWLRETMNARAAVGDMGYCVDTRDEEWVDVKVRVNLDGAITEHWWSARRDVYEKGGIDELMKSQYGRRNPMLKPQPWPPEPPKPGPPWLVYRDRPMGYQFMNRLEGPDVVQVLKARHGEEGDATWPPLQ